MEVKRRTLVRILRAHGVYETARGKGSHTLWELRDQEGRVVGTTTVPGYRGIDELLWRKIEKDLSTQLGARWLRDAL